MAGATSAGTPQTQKRKISKTALVSTAASLCAILAFTGLSFNFPFAFAADVKAAIADLRDQDRAILLQQMQGQQAQSVEVVKSYEEMLSDIEAQMHLITKAGQEVPIYMKQKHNRLLKYIQQANQRVKRYESQVQQYQRKINQKQQSGERF